MSNRNYEKGGHLIGKDGVRREILLVSESFIHLKCCSLPVPKWAADCMDYEPPKRDEWLTEEDRKAHIGTGCAGVTAAIYNRILESRLGKPSEWVRKRDVARAVWHADGELRSNGIDRLADLGITHELAKEAGDE